jgi:very-short-patch-repair endonuclease
VVETDGEGSHGTPVAFQRDRKRDQILVAAGYRVARATWRQMYHELDDVVTRISRTLELAAASQPTPQLLNRVVP